MLKDKLALGVLGGARTARAQAVEEVCRDVLRSMRPGKVAQNPDYHKSRTHFSLGKDPPEPRPVQNPEFGFVIELPEVGTWE